MKAVIVFTDDDGNTWEHELPLVAHRRVGQGPQGTRGVRAKRAEARKPPRSRQTAELDFSLPIRPFIKRYAKGVSGPRRFAILVAHLAKGDVKAEIAFKDIVTSTRSVDALVKHFKAEVDEYHKGEWEKSLSKGGKFIEAVLKALLVEAGLPAQSGRQFKVDKAINDLGGLPSGGMDETIRLTIPRCCRFIYDVTSN